jgi:hypothetical protein
LLVGVAFVAAAAGGLLGVVLARQLAWPEASAALLPSMLGAGVVLAVGAFAAVLMQLQAAGVEKRVANALLAGTTVRLLGTMFGGLVVSLLITQDRPMWLGLLCAGLIALSLDTLVLLKATAQASSAQASTVQASSDQVSGGEPGATSSTIHPAFAAAGTAPALTTLEKETA